MDVESQPLAVALSHVGRAPRGSAPWWLPGSVAGGRCARTAHPRFPPPPRRPPPPSSVINRSSNRHVAVPPTRSDNPARSALKYNPRRSSRGSSTVGNNARAASARVRPQNSSIVALVPARARVEVEITHATLRGAARAPSAAARDACVIYRPNFTTANDGSM